MRFEIERAWRAGLGILAIHIHNLKDREGLPSKKGANPFDGVIVNGRAVEGRAYDPPFSDSAAVYGYIQDNVGQWISDAVEARGPSARARGETN